MSFETGICPRICGDASNRTSGIASAKHWRTSSTHASFSTVTQLVCDLYSRVSCIIFFICSSVIARFTLT